MKFSKLNLFSQLGFLVLVLLCGCGVQKTVDAMDSDANGYQCPQCKLKYYTDRNVIASACPGCKTGTPMGVIGFVCPKDNHMTIVSQTAGSAKCEQCQGEAIDKKMPRESDLKAWGAVKKTEKEVSP